MRSPGYFVILAMFGRALGAAENDLPQRQPGEPQDAESALFRNDLSDVLPGTKARGFQLLAPEPPIDVERAKADLDRAERKQQRWEKLARAGVLARVEVESCVLQTARARAAYEKARFAAEQKSLEALRQRAAGGTATAEAVSAAEAAVRTAEGTAADAEAALRQMQLAIAEVNVDRQRRLMAAGAGSKAQLKRAEGILAQLKSDDR